MNALAAAFASSLLASPVSAAPNRSVYRPPIAVAGEVSVSNLEALRRRVDEEFARAEFESLTPVDLSVCSTTPCWTSQAHASGSRYIASISVDASEADQRLVMKIVDLTDGSTIVELARTCELCGRDERLDATADLSAAALRKLQSHAAITTEVSVDSIPAGARVVLDGEAVGTTPLRLEVSPGVHTVELSAPGYEPFSRAIDFIRGTSQSVRPQLSATTQPLPQADILAERPKRRRGRLVAGAALLGGGFVAAAAGATLVVLHGRPITSDCSGSEVDSDGDCHFLHDTRVGGIIGLSTGGAAIIGGAVLLSLELRRGRPGAVALSPTLSGIRVRGRF